MTEAQQRQSMTALHARLAAVIADAPPENALIALLALVQATARRAPVMTAFAARVCGELTAKELA